VVLADNFGLTVWWICTLFVTGTGGWKSAPTSCDAKTGLLSQRRCAGLRDKEISSINGDLTILEETRCDAF